MACEGLSKSSSEDKRKIQPENLVATTYVDMVELGKGCSGNCASCGAFEDNGEPVKVFSITPDQLEANLLQEFKSVSPDLQKPLSSEVQNTQIDTRLRVIDLFRSYVTTGVDMEPLETDIFPDAAEMIYSLSEGNSRLVCISHGLRCVQNQETGEWEPVPAQVERLAKINELMIKKDKNKKDLNIVPLYVLSMDPARAWGALGSLNLQEKLKEFENPTSIVMKYFKFVAVEEQQREGVKDPLKDESKEKWEKRLENVKTRVIEAVLLKQKKGEVLSKEEVLVLEYSKAKDAFLNNVIEANAQAYAATLATLVPAILDDKRVTISLQGDKNPSSALYIGLTFKIQQRTYAILKEKYFPDEDDVSINNILTRLNIVPPRFYTGAGRAKARLGIKDRKECTVIPDPDFVEQQLWADPYKVNRGKLDKDGKLWIQMYNGRATYSDTVDSPKNNPWLEVDLSAEENVNSIQIPELKTVCDRLRFYANPKVIDLGDVAWENPISRISDLHSSFEQISLDDQEKILAIVKQFAVKKGLTTEEDFSLEEFLTFETAHDFVIKALVPETEMACLKKEGEEEDDTLERLKNRIVKLYTPDFNDKVQATKMGEILTIRGLLRELLDIKVKIG